MPLKLAVAREVPSSADGTPCIQSPEDDRQTNQVNDKHPGISCCDDIHAITVSLLVCPVAAGLPDSSRRAMTSANATVMAPAK